MMRGPLTLLALLLLSPGCRATTPSDPRRPASGAGRPTGPVPGAPVSLPVVVDEDRFIVVPRTVDGRIVALFTDTGGGLYISRDAAVRLKLPIAVVEGDGGRSIEAALLPDFAPDADIPPLEELGGRLPVLTDEHDRRARLDRTSEGMLGQAWFRGRVWTFDYPGRKLWWRAAGDVPAHAPAHRVSLGFPVDASDERETNFPRISIEVDGGAIDLLFDTGATVLLTPPALAAIGDGRPAARATSFIVRSIFDRWRRQHPDWRVVDGADANLGGEPMIEVPRIEVGGFSVGPVWFTRRPDAEFHEYMSSLMDRRVEGALGGTALRFFRVTVDYPNAVAVFERAGS